MMIFPVDNVEYNAREFAKHAAQRTRGVYNVEEDFPVSLVSDMQISVGAGKAWMLMEEDYGVICVEEAPTLFTLEYGDAGAVRTDFVALVLDKLANAAYLEIRSGNREPRRDHLFDEIFVARVDVPRGAITLAESSIVDIRTDAALCGQMQEVIERVPTSMLEDQFNDWASSLESNNSFVRANDYTRLSVFGTGTIDDQTVTFTTDFMPPESWEPGQQIIIHPTTPFTLQEYGLAWGEMESTIRCKPDSTGHAQLFIYDGLEFVSISSIPEGGGEP
jgi:hypothetical protein